MRNIVLWSRLSLMAIAPAMAGGCARLETADIRTTSRPEQIDTSRLTLAPLHFVGFCMRNGSECAARGPAEAVVELTPQTLAVLESVNRQVNARIQPSNRDDDWRINPASGNCNDYVVSKRHELLARGMPSSALLINVVKTQAGEGHLVLIVKTDRGEFVLDNLVGEIRPTRDTRYVWIKRQTSRDPRLWETA